MKCAFVCRLGEEAVLILVDGPAALPAALPTATRLHEPTWYALFYFLREVGTLQCSMNELVDQVTSATSPEAQLEVLNQFQPALDKLPQASWDMAVHHVLGRAATVARLMRGCAAEHQAIIVSPVTLMQSADDIGKHFDQITKALCCSTMQHIKLGTSHTQSLLCDESRQEVARHLRTTIQQGLKQSL